MKFTLSALVIVIPTMLVVTILLLLVVATTATTQASSSSTSCSCCCPLLQSTLDLHSLETQRFGQHVADTFSSSKITGRRQTVLPSEGIVTIASEIVLEQDEIQAITSSHHTNPSSSDSNTNNNNNAGSSSSTSTYSNCSWSNPTSARCSLDICVNTWLGNEVTFSISSLEGIVPDLLATGEYSVSATVAVQTMYQFESFQRRMQQQSSNVIIGAIYFVDDPQLCNNGVSGLTCFLDRFWYLPHSAKAWVADITVPLGETPIDVVDKILPQCESLVSKMKEYSQNSDSSGSSGPPALIIDPSSTSSTSSTTQNSSETSSSSTTTTTTTSTTTTTTTLPTTTTTSTTLDPNSTFTTTAMLETTTPSTTVASSDQQTTTPSSSSTTTAPIDYSSLSSSQLTQLRKQIQQQSLEWLVHEYISNSSSTMKRNVILSRPNRILCASPPLPKEAIRYRTSSSSTSSNSNSNRRYKKPIVAVVPIVRSTSDVVFETDAQLVSCIDNNHRSPVSIMSSSNSGSSSTSSSSCSVVPRKEFSCGSFDVKVSNKYSFAVYFSQILGFIVAIVSSLALLFGASAIMIAIDAQLLAVIALGSCSSNVALPATKYLEQFLFLGRTPHKGVLPPLGEGEGGGEQVQRNVVYYSSVIGYLIGLIVIAVLGHALLVLLISVIRRSIIRAAQAEREEENEVDSDEDDDNDNEESQNNNNNNSSGDQKSNKTESQSSSPSKQNTQNTGEKNKNSNKNDDEKSENKNDNNKKKKKKKNIKNKSLLERIFVPPELLAGRRQQQGGGSNTSKNFLTEERRILARTAAMLRFPSASLVIVLVALQGLWFAALQVWWYSTTPVESMPGIVGGLFALLLTLIILVLARQTRLIFTPYSWLHPEQAEADAREQALEVTAKVAARSLLGFKRAWFFPFGAWSPERQRLRMGILFLPVKERSWIGVPFLVSLVTCIAVSIYPLTILGCCAQQLFLALFFFGCALIFWKSQPMRAPYANTMFVAVRGSLSVLTFCRTVTLVTTDEYFEAAYFILIVLVQILIIVVGVIDIWTGLAEYFVFLPHLEKRQEIIRIRTGGALRRQRLHEEEGFSSDSDDDDDDENDNDNDEENNNAENYYNNNDNNDYEGGGDSYGQSFDNENYDFDQTENGDQAADEVEMYRMDDI